MRKIKQHNSRPIISEASAMLNQRLQIPDQSIMNETPAMEKNEALQIPHQSSMKQHNFQQHNFHTKSSMKHLQ
jgi:hypothetical protein